MQWSKALDCHPDIYVVLIQAREFIRATADGDKRLREVSITRIEGLTFLSTLTLSLLAVSCTLWEELKMQLVLRHKLFK